MLWRFTGLIHLASAPTGSGLLTLIAKLTALIEKIRHKPRDHHTLLLLVEIATFAASWDRGGIGLCEDLMDVSVLYWCLLKHADSFI